MTTRRLKRIGIAAGILMPLCLCSASEASAQEWLKDRRYSEGDGYRVGDLELHPGIAGEAGYDSNWFLRSSKTGANIINGSPQNPVEGAGEFRLTGSLDVSTIGSERRESEGNGPPPAVTFRGGVNATYRTFVGPADLRNQGNVGGDVNARVDILQSRPWGGDLFADATRTIQPNVVSDLNDSFNRIDLTAGGDLIATPNSGTLSWRLGYTIHGSLFEESNATPFSNITNQLNTHGSWKFRPRTALIYDASLSFTSYEQADRAITLLHNSDPLRARLGISGLVTSRVALLAMAGYGASFFQPGSDARVQQYQSVIGQAEAKFFLTANPHDEPGSASLTLSSLSIGYNRDFVNSYLGDFYGTDRGYLKLQYFFAGRALVSLEGGAGAIEYPNVYFNTGSGTTLGHAAFTDTRVDATLFAEYRFISSLGINMTLAYAQNFSNAQLAFPVSGAQAQVYDMSWQHYQAFLGLRWLM